MEKAIMKAKDKIAEEITALVKKENLLPEEVKCLGEFIDMAKDISTIEGMDTYADYLMEDDYSTAPYPMRMPRVSYDGASYRRGRSPSTGRYVSRDARPRHTDRSYGYSEDDMMRNSGHSINDRMIDALEQMYDKASTDHERQIVDKWIKKMSSEA